MGLGLHRYRLERLFRSLDMHQFVTTVHAVTPVSDVSSDLGTCDLELQDPYAHAFDDLCLLACTCQTLEKKWDLRVFVSESMYSTYYVLS